MPTPPKGPKAGRFRDKDRVEASQSGGLDYGGGAGADGREMENDTSIRQARAGVQARLRMQGEVRVGPARQIRRGAETKRAKRRASLRTVGAGPGEGSNEKETQTGARVRKVKAGKLQEEGGGVIRGRGSGRRRRRRKKHGTGRGSDRSGSGTMGVCRLDWDQEDGVKMVRMRTSRDLGDSCIYGTQFCSL
jgi:hypothetical protein